MAAGFGITIEIDKKEAKRLDKKFKTLPAAVVRRINRRASSQAITPVLKSAKAKVPKRKGLLKKSLGRKQKSYPRNDVVYSMVGPRKGFKDEEGNNPVNYAHLVEKGTKYAKAQPFLRPAMEENRAKVTSIYKNAMAAGINKEALK